jgi:hypothetical protein
VHSGYQLQYIEPLEERECAAKRRVLIGKELDFKEFVYYNTRSDATRCAGWRFVGGGGL